MDEILGIFRQKWAFFIPPLQIFVRPGKRDCALPLHTRNIPVLPERSLEPCVPRCAQLVHVSEEAFTPPSAWVTGWRTLSCRLLLRSDTSALMTCSLT